MKEKLKEILLSGQNTVLVAPSNVTKEFLFQKISSDTNLIGSYIDLTSQTAADKTCSFNFRFNDQFSESVALDNIMNLLKQLDAF